MARGGSPQRDLYDVVVQLSPEQANEVRSQGIAFKICTKSGEEIWAQSFGKNFRAHADD